MWTWFSEEVAAYKALMVTDERNNLFSRLKYYKVSEDSFEAQSIVKGIYFQGNDHVWDTPGEKLN